ncbi:MAG: putative ATPase [Deltaproteobacteria bacterium]|nr:putative ATPase [Deltaproteobacteria bacterium]
MVMVVRCSSCMTEYRLNEALLKGARGACIRCPKCRERIIVENPHAPPVAPSITKRITPPVVPPSATQRVPPPVVPPSATQRVPPPVVTPPITQWVAPPVVTRPITLPVPPPVVPPSAAQRVTPPVVPPSITPRVEPPATQTIPQRDPSPIGPPDPTSVVPQLASRPVPRFTPPIVPAQIPGVAPPAAVETGTPPIRVTAPGSMASPIPRDRGAGGADLSGMIRSDPVAGSENGIVVSPTPDVVADPHEIPGGKALRLEELFIHPSAVKGDRIPEGREDGRSVIRSPGTVRAPSPRRPRYQRPLFLAAVISIFLLAGGAFYFVDGNSGRKSSGNVLPVQARSAPEIAVFEVGNLEGNLRKQASGEPIYIVKGTVTNVGKALSSGIRIEATLLGRDNQAIVKNGTFAGNVIDETLIPHMNRVRIEGFLGMRYGEGDVNRNIPAGKTLSFMVVFFDPPEGIESFAVNAMNAEETERIPSQDAKESGTRASNLQAIRLN